MVLHKLTEFDPDYRETFEGNDIKNMGVYAEGTDERIGSVNDVLVDEEGRFRYLIVDLGFWIFGKKVLLPVGRSRVDHNADRVYAVGMTRAQAENLPEYNENQTLDYDYEERVRGGYRSSENYAKPVETSAPLNVSTPLEAEASAPLNTNYQDYQAPSVAKTPIATPTPTYDRNAYKYEGEPSLFNMNEQDHQTLRLYEERLIANKRRQKTGEVTIGKHVETETARVAVPVEKERVVIERVTPDNAGRAVSAGEANFRDGEVARVEVYEETADIQKETILREEVRVKKVVDHETVQAQDTIRREELDINTNNLPVEER
ncbi:MAG: DUF2382 domain-containing protein [Rhizonema sp. PD38]|nr:DUF2382 domain-containing protein [Rhizonema sp. PD38]